MHASKRRPEAGQRVLPPAKAEARCARAALGGPEGKASRCATAAGSLQGHARSGRQHNTSLRCASAGCASSRRSGRRRVANRVSQQGPLHSGARCFWGGAEQRSPQEERAPLPAAPSHKQRAFASSPARAGGREACRRRMCSGSQPRLGQAAVQYLVHDVVGEPHRLKRLQGCRHSLSLYDQAVFCSVCFCRHAKVLLASRQGVLGTPIGVGGWCSPVRHAIHAGCL